MHFHGIYFHGSQKNLILCWIFYMMCSENVKPRKFLLAKISDDKVQLALGPNYPTCYSISGSAIRIVSNFTEWAGIMRRQKLQVFCFPKNSPFLGKWVILSHFGSKLQNSSQDPLEEFFWNNTLIRSFAFFCPFCESFFCEIFKKDLSAKVFPRKIWIKLLEFNSFIGLS